MKIRILAFLLLTIISCEKANNNKLENFDEFDRRFHSDSLFQISRITFPLEGKLIDGFQKKNWSKSEWEMLKVRIKNNTLEPKYQHKTSYSDSLVVEKIWIENSGFSFERKFRNLNGKWFLVYLNDINL